MDLHENGLMFTILIDFCRIWEEHHRGSTFPEKMLERVAVFGSLVRHSIRQEERQIEEPRSGLTQTWL